MNPKSVFRLLVLASILSGVAVDIAAIMLSNTLPDPLHEWTRAEVERDPTAGEIAVGVAALVILFVGLVDTLGLLLFWRWARPVGIVLVVLGGLLAAAAGPFVMFGWELAIGSLSCFFGGVTLTMAYCWPPVRMQFEGESATINHA